MTVRVCDVCDICDIAECYTHALKTHRLIRNAIQTPDGTILESRSRHDYITYTDKNGKEYMVDGGLDYQRRSAHGDERDLCLYDDEPHEVQRTVLTWGTYGKDGKQPFSRVAIRNMESSHIEAVLKECRPAQVYKNCMLNELDERHRYGND